MAKSRVSAKFDRCVKSVKKTVRARKGSNKESAAIAICTKSVLHKRGRTLKKYRKGRLTTQRKFRGGDKSAAETIKQRILDPKRQVVTIEGVPMITIKIDDIENYVSGVDHLIAKVKPGMFSFSKTDTRKMIVDALTEAKTSGKVEISMPDEDVKKIDAYLTSLTV